MGTEHKSQRAFMKRWLHSNTSRPSSSRPKTSRPSSSRAKMDRTAYWNRKKHQAAQAKETIACFSALARARPDAPQDGFLCLPDRYCPLTVKKTNEPKSFPNMTTEVQVVDGDSFDVAIHLTNARAKTKWEKKPVCVMNLANAQRPGGGFENGAMAQEEALCQRSTLYGTLKRHFYPLRPREVLYSPTVLIFRDNLKTDHAMMDTKYPEKYPVMAVVSVAGQYKPPLNTSTNPYTYANEEDRELMKEKIRITLRVSAHNGHCSLVLGALGCGAFKNPNEVVADCFGEVITEHEFRGWFSNIVFGVMGDKSNVRDNYDVFKERLHGLQIQKF